MFIDPETDVPIQYTEVAVDFFNGHSEAYRDEEFDEHFDLAYAMTVHKAQGAQYERILFHLDAQVRSGIQTARNVYTAITRAEESVCIMGEVITLECALNKTNTLEERVSAPLALLDEED